jgi:hypothetical protein
VIAVELLWHKVVVWEAGETIFTGEPCHDVVTGQAGPKGCVASLGNPARTPLPSIGILEAVLA